MTKLHLCCFKCKQESDHNLDYYEGFLCPHCGQGFYVWYNPKTEMNEVYSV